MGPDPEPEATLSISDLAERTDVAPATLRSWESRYGFPAPRRLAGGHRRYADRDVAVVEEVLRLRASGLSLPAAVDRATAQVGEPETSVFAGLRRRHPDLQPQVVHKTTLLSLSRAVEDECCARARNPVLFASFQTERFYRQSTHRWAELARTARAVAVLADFAAPSAPGETPMRVPVPRTSPVRREWALVCDAPDQPACLAGWEVPEQQGLPDPARRFEMVWSVDPRVVRDAAHVCVELVTTFAPELGLLVAEQLSGTPPHASADLRRSAGVLDRMIGYLDRSGAR
jgi:MerR family transcriptional regulator, light-induced transcriptional regulator